jgi:hypothetical protein
MSEELSGESLSRLKSIIRKDNRSVEARMVAETQPLGYSQRRQLYRTERTEQTNLKFTPAFKKRLLALAHAANESLTEYIERAVVERAERDPHR